MATKIFEDFRQVVSVPEPSPEWYDDRLGVFSINNTYTIDTYRRYISLLNALVSMGNNLPQRIRVDGADYMLKMGFLPLVMAPYFWHDRAHAMILPHIPKELPYYPRPAVTFTPRHNNWQYPDIWVSKLDVARLCGKRPELVRTEEALQLCGL